MNETLLVVDDEPGIVAMMRAYFEMNGYRVATAQSGEEALAKISCRPDLILLDIPSSGSVTYDGQDIHSGSDRVLSALRPAAGSVLFFSSSICYRC